jgi:plasmid stabilization system protein ParE
VKPVLFLNEAAVELDDAAAWYERRQPGLGRRFLRYVEDTLNRIHERPQSGIRHQHTSFRFLLTKRFPYVIYYLEQNDVILVAAVAHAARQPDYWKDRQLPD